MKTKIKNVPIKPEDLNEFQIVFADELKECQTDIIAINELLDIFLEGKGYNVEIKEYF